MQMENSKKMFFSVLRKGLLLVDVFVIIKSFVGIFLNEKNQNMFEKTWETDRMPKSVFKIIINQCYYERKKANSTNMRLA